MYNSFIHVYPRVIQRQRPLASVSRTLDNETEILPRYGHTERDTRRLPVARLIIALQKKEVSLFAPLNLKRADMQQAERVKKPCPIRLQSTLAPLHGDRPSP